MEYIVGITLALFFCAAAAGLGMDRERVFYPAVAITVASYYLAFSAGDGRAEVWLTEVAIAAVFIVGAVLSFKRSPWIAVLAPTPVTAEPTARRCPPARKRLTSSDIAQARRWTATGTASRASASGATRDLNADAGSVAPQGAPSHIRSAATGLTGLAR